jgi:hypothetical protein
MKKVRNSCEARMFLALVFLFLLVLVVESYGSAKGAQNEVIFRDWLIQDAAGNVDQCFKSSTDYTLEKAILDKVFVELGTDGARLNGEFIELQKTKAPGSDPRWRDLYSEACQLRRGKRFEPLVNKYNSIIFTKHYNLGGSHYAYTENLSDTQYQEKRNDVTDRHGGASLCILRISPSSRISQETLLSEAKGVIRDPAVSYDGKRVLFAWRKSMTEDDYHLYEMEVDSRKIRQLTSGKGFADIEPCYLPNGDIIFNSTRCVQIVDCWWTEVSNLYTCNKDGNYMRRISFDQVHTNYPQVLGDGRVIYTRWDYNDRGQIFTQPLFVMNSDGTGQTEFYGNNSWFPTTILHARGIPDTQKLVAIISGHHNHQRGKLAIIDPALGRQEAQGVQLIAPVRETIAERIDSYGQEGEQFQYPFAISETVFLVSADPVGSRNRSYARPYGIYLVDIDGRRELLAYDDEISCNQPVPLAPREPTYIRANLVDYSKNMGTFYVQDVYDGPGLDGIAHGTVKRLRVVALEYRAAGIGRVRAKGPSGSGNSITPPAIVHGTRDVKRVLGSTVVHKDGSALFTVPARTPVYFQLLDEKNHAVQSMRSWSTLQPGETYSCGGCHEHKNTAVPGRMTMALQQPPLELEHFYGLPRGFSYTKEIQPIFDTHCIDCHSSGQPAEDGKSVLSLLGKTVVDIGAKRQWSESYVNLTQNGKPNRIVQWLNVQSIPPMLPPYYAGAAKSELIELLEGGHEGVKLSREELDKIACWIDLLVPFCGDYTEANDWTDKEKSKYAHFQSKRDRMEAIERKNIEALLQNQDP